MSSVDNILKNRNITLPTKVRLVKAMVFPVVMYGCRARDGGGGDGGRGGERAGSATWRAEGRRTGASPRDYACAVRSSGLAGILETELCRQPDRTGLCKEAVP